MLVFFRLLFSSLTLAWYCTFCLAFWWPTSATFCSVNFLMSFSRAELAFCRPWTVSLYLSSSPWSSSAVETASLSDCRRRCISANHSSFSSSDADKASSSDWILPFISASSCRLASPVPSVRPDGIVAPSYHSRASCSARDLPSAASCAAVSAAWARALACSISPSISATACACDSLSSAMVKCSLALSSCIWVSASLLAVSMVCFSSTSCSICASAAAR
mmetsp:Transcript_3213/g.8227  ORF Transcript_3213/g.8227 Transcript_3213/m.8227 type:complete len:220 (-) Transcript_3213:342-1001(-)